MARPPVRGSTLTKTKSCSHRLRTIQKHEPNRKPNWSSASPEKQKRYSWDYDSNYELYSFDRITKEYRRLTNAKGYDAEGSYSPDGKLIAFASNRNAYRDDKPLGEEAQKKFEKDLSIEMEIFIMDSDGSNVRQLTDVRGYDGGPFFSPDGKTHLLAAI